MDRRHLAILPVLGLVFAAYIGVPQAGWVWDDHALVVYNRALAEPTWTNLFGKDLWCCVANVEPTGYYRPLLTLTLLLDTKLFGVEPAGYHVVSLLWHLVTTSLAYLALRDRIGPVRAAVAALIFGIHPLQSEAVTWVAARNDLLAGAGIFGALVALDRGRLAVATGCALAACLSKENAFLLPVIAWMWRRAWGERLTLREAGAIGIGLAIAMGLRLQAELNGLGIDGNHKQLAADTFFHAVVKVLGWITWPWPLTTTASLYAPPPSLTGWASGIATIVLFGWLLARGGTRARWLLAMALFTWLPALAGIYWYGTIGERYLYVSMFGVAAAAAATLPATRVTFGALGAAVVLAIGALHVRVPDWASESTLFQAAVLRAPDGFSWSLLGTHLFQKGEHADASRALEQAIHADPPQHRACRHLPKAADYVLDDTKYRARAQAWLDAGCHGVDFDVSLAMALAARHQWDLAGPRIQLLGRKDKARREEILRAALALHDGDLTEAGRIALAWPSGPSDLADQAWTLVRGNPSR